MVVVGGGITGLAAARTLVDGRPDVEVLLLEGVGPRSAASCGCGEVAGVTVDLGAESILNRRPEGVALARAAGLGDAVVHPETAAARVWSRGALRPLPRSVMGVPADLDGAGRVGGAQRRRPRAGRAGPRPAGHRRCPRTT